MLAMTAPLLAEEKTRPYKPIITKV